MSEEVSEIERARDLLERAIAACEELNHTDPVVLSELAAHRIQWPVLLMGRKGRTKNGKKVSEFMADLNLGQSVPVNSDLPGTEVKAFILALIDRAYAMRSQSPPPEPKLEDPDSLAKYTYDFGQWCLDVRAIELDTLSEKSKKDWLDYLVEGFLLEFENMIETEPIGEGEDERFFETGYPAEMERRGILNQQKLLRRKMKTDEKKARNASKANASFDFFDDWKKYYARRAREEHFDLPAKMEPIIRESVSEILNSVMHSSP